MRVASSVTRQHVRQISDFFRQGKLGDVEAFAEEVFQRYWLQLPKAHPESWQRAALLRATGVCFVRLLRMLKACCSKQRVDESFVASQLPRFESVLRDDLAAKGPAGALPGRIKPLATSTHDSGTPVARRAGESGAAGLSPVARFDA